MPVTSAEQIVIQGIINAASPNARRDLYAEAEETLLELGWEMGRRFLSSDESKAIDLAVEMIVRIEATERKRGFWFRFKRRMQVIQMYVGA